MSRRLMLHDATLPYAAGMSKQRTQSVVLIFSRQVIG